MPLSPALRALVCTLFCFAVGCGGGADAPSPPGTGGGTPADNEIFGGERLGWNQAGASAAAVRSFVFNLYVDGARASLGDTRCGDEAGGAGYECSGLLPTMAVGTRVLRLTATSNGVESAPSLPLTVTVGRRVEASAIAPLPDEGAPHPPEDARDRSGSASACFDSEPRTCYRIERVAEGLGTVTSLASLPDGRVLFVEDGRRVRVLAGGTVLDEPAFAAEPGTHVSGLAVHPDYARNQTVYTALTAVSGEGYAVSVQRHRNVQNTLGEAATIVADLPAASPDVLLAVSANRHVYLAFPAHRERPATGPYDGLVLRFAEDGSVPRDGRTGSPVFSLGYAQPTGLATFDGKPELWISGDGGAVGGALAQVRPGQSRWPRLPSPLRIPSNVLTTAETQIRSLSVTGSSHGGQTTILYVTDAPSTLHIALLGGLNRASVTASTTLCYSAENLQPRSLMASRDGVVYIAVTSPTREGDVILLLRPRL